MPDRQDKQNHKPRNKELPIERAALLIEGGAEERGRVNGPPQATTDGNVAKQWQPPKNQSVPSNRPKKE
jgi:hypothetical protein